MLPLLLIRVCSTIKLEKVRKRMGLCRVEAVVLNHRSLGEADKLLTLYTRERGKVRGVARGARRPRNRFLATSQPFSQVELLLYQGKGLYYVSQSELVTSFYALREQLERMAAAAYVCELLEVLVEEACPQPRLFALLVATLHLLTATSDLRPALRHFELGLLEEVGWGPESSRCASCGVSPLSEGVKVSGRLGGFTCAACGNRDRDAVSLAPGTLAMLERLRRSTPRGVASLRWQDSLAGEMEEAMQRFLEVAGVGRMKSRPFLHWAEEQCPAPEH